jgi:hypothetical protein
MGGCASTSSTLDAQGALVNEAVILIKPHCSNSKAFVDFVVQRLKDSKVRIEELRRDQFNRLTPLSKDPYNQVR